MSARRFVGLIVALAVVPAASGSTWAAPPAPATTSAVQQAEPPASAPGRAPFDEEPGDCLVGSEPQELSPAGALVGPRVALDVVVLLDEVDEARGRATFATAAKVYDLLGIDLNATFVVPPSPLPSDGPAPAPDRGTIDGDHAMALLKQHFGGRRPAGSDLVYLLTAKDLTKTDVDGSRSTSLAGRADCIGGVRYASAAFAIGEEEPDVTYQGLPSLVDQGGRIAAHELGHLMGAHHHYASCAEGDPTQLPRSWHVCTVMFPDTFFVGYRFSAVNGAIVRGLAERHAA